MSYNQGGLENEGLCTDGLLWFFLTHETLLPATSSMTLSQTEKGYPPPIEHIGVPRAVLKEKGTDWDRPRTPFHKPWHRMPYLKQRKDQLTKVMKELDPHNPVSSPKIFQ